MTSMLSTSSQQHLEQITRQRRRAIGAATVCMTTTLTAVFWLLTIVTGGSTPAASYLIPMAGQLGLLAAILCWGVTLPIFGLLALTLDVGLVCTLFLPGAHQGHILVFFSAVPLCYILGGPVWGRVGTASFFLLTAVLMILKGLFHLSVPNLVAPQEGVIAAITCLVLQVIMAEANEGEHQRRLEALSDHQFREPNSGLLNRNALHLRTIAPGQGLTLIRFSNLALEEVLTPGRLGKALLAMAFPPENLFWISEDEYVLVKSTESSIHQEEQRLADRLLASGLPGLHARSSVRIACVRATTLPEPASRLLMEAELQMLVSHRPGPLDLDSSLRLHDVAGALRTCFSERRLQAYFQPIYDGEAGGIAFLEGLTRLNLEGGWVGPEKYLGLIGSLGLDRQLTEFILEETLKMGLNTEYSVSFNLTFQDLEDASILPQLLDACAQFRNRGNQLILELTEHIAFSDTSILVNFVEQVHQAGGLVFLDDFGMGYSNYASIAAARFDAIKVAGSMILQAPASEEIRVLLTGVARFAEASGIGLVAEHISSQAVYEMAKGVGIRYHQGFLLHVPVPGAEIDSENFEFALQSDHELARVVNSRSVPFGRTLKNLSP
jgi:EAL domain-containing protein (putative c-di-GMP-specific phosphodiesterase class I)